MRTDAGQSTITSAPTNWWITDMNGKTVWNGTADAVTDVGKQVMLERPSPGFYLLWMKSKNLIQVERFTVIH